MTELVHAGRDVRTVSRGGQAPDGAQGVLADVSDPVQAARASVIYHCASPPYTQWPELFPALTRSILDAAESGGARLVFADNLYAYGPVDGPLREDLPAVAQGPKGKIRSEMAAQPLAAYRNGQARVVIGRASDYYGPHGTGSTAGETVFGRILAGKKPQGTGRLDQPYTFHYLPDIARGLLVLADRREADGQVWHLPAAAPLTAQQFFDMIAKAAGQPAPVHASIASPALLAVAGIFLPLLREMRETTYQFHVIETFGDTAVPRLAETPGFCGALLFVDPASGRLISQSLWHDARSRAAGPSTAAVLQADLLEAARCVIRAIDDYTLVFSSARKY